MTVSSSTNKVSYSGNGTLTAFAYTFKVFDEDDLTVILRASDGTETVQTITTHYTVSGVGDAGGGNVTFVTAPATGVTVVIVREPSTVQGLDLVANDPFPAGSLEDALDKIVFITQKHEEQLSRTITASRSNTLTTNEFTDSASDRANKVMAFDGSGDLDLTQEIGVFQGNWASGTNYSVRDIVKDTNTNNIYIANTAHTSTGSIPLNLNVDFAKWDLLVDAASATTSATNAATSATAAQTAQTAAETAQTAAETAQTNAETAETNAETAQTAAETAKTAAETAQTAAETALDSFDDIYLGAKSADPSVDNDGDPLQTGALFYNTTSEQFKFYNGTTWNVTSAPGLSAVSEDSAPSLGGDLTLGGNDIIGTGDINITGSIDGTTLKIGGTSITATAAEINYLDITTLGTSEASKAVTADANGDVNLAEELKAKSYNETYQEVSSSSNATTINCENGNAFLTSLTENTTFTFSNPPASNTAYSFSLEISQDATGTDYTVTWPSSVQWPGGTAPTLTDSAALQVDVDLFIFYTKNGGSTWFGFTAGQAMG